MHRLLSAAPILLILLLSACNSLQSSPPLAPAQTTPLPVPSPVAFDPAIQITLTTVIEDLDRPVFITHAGDGSGRRFIIEKEGRIRILEGDTLLEAPFLDISDRINAGGNEQGLLGLAFPPDYARRGFFFVNYTNKSGDTVISRFTLTNDLNVADPQSESFILQVDQPASNHNGGMLAFGPDQMLWIGLGDGGGGGDRYGNGQNSETLLGKILRIDVLTDPSQPYTIPADNPWPASADSIRDEIWAMGLRNPWRFSFDRLTGDLWIGDVGQNQIEEIDYVPTNYSGLNFGWPILEGTSCYKESDCSAQGMTLPVAQYKHGADGCSVTGGYVYQGAKFPELVGVYLYSDYCSGRIWAVWPDAEGKWQDRQLLDSDLSISSFGEDEAGELYIVAYGGDIYQITTQKD